MADLIFKINGAEYPINDIGVFVQSLTIDECGVYHQWTGRLIEDIADADVNSLMIAAFMQIAYMRGNPGISPQVARKAVGDSNLNEALAAFNAAEEDDQTPLEHQQTKPAQSGPPGNRPVVLRSSGSDSTPSSETPTNELQGSGSHPWALSVTSAQAKSGT